MTAFANPPPAGAEPLSGLFRNRRRPFMNPYVSQGLFSINKIALNRKLAFLKAGRRGSTYGFGLGHSSGTRGHRIRPEMGIRGIIP